MSLEIAFDYRQFCWFQPLIGDYIDLQMGTADLKQPLPISRCRRALWIPTIMWGGPIRFRLLVDVEESRAGAELGPHDRREAPSRSTAKGPRTASWTSTGVQSS